MKVHSIKTAFPRFTLYPLSDVHWPKHDEKKLDSWREAVLTDPYAVVTLGGDLYDFARTKYRKHLASYTGDENSRTPLDDMAMTWVEQFAEYLKPIASKVALTVVGNHAWTFANGRVSDQELAIKLGREETFAGELGLLRVDVAGLRNVRVALHHHAGKKGGTISSDLLAFQHMSHVIDADVFILGHTHRAYAGVFGTRITVPDHEDKVTDKKLVFMRSGSFLKGYSENVLDPRDPFIPDYAESFCLAPSVLGYVTATADVRNDGKLNWSISQRTL